MPSIGSVTALAAKADRQKYENHPDDKVDHGAVEHVTLPDSAFSDPGPKTFESGRTLLDLSGNGNQPSSVQPRSAALS
jgi:hypothetical protein